MREYLWTYAGMLLGLLLGSLVALVVQVTAVRLGSASDNAVLRLVVQVLAIGGMFYGGFRGWLHAGGLSRR